MKSLSFTHILIITLAVLFGSHSFLIRSGLISYTKEASNFFSSRARAQAAVYSDAKIILLGSSLSGRIPGCESGNMTIANFGVDGQTFAAGLRWLNLRRNKQDDVVILETNMIHGLKNTVFGEISLWEKLGTKIPELRASSRPSAMLYSALKNGFQAKRGNWDVDHEVDVRNYLVYNESNFQPKEEDLLLLSELTKIQHAGGKVVFVEYPSGDRSIDSFSSRKSRITWLASKLNSSFYNFSHLVEEGVVQLSDGVHLDADSAKVFSSIIQQIAQR